MPLEKDPKTKLAATCLLMTLVSFGGFCFESIFVAITDRYIDNRNMVLPFLLGYGLAMTAIYFIFGTPASPTFLGHKLSFKNSFLNWLYYFAVVFLFISVGECLWGTCVELFFDVTWWDYSQIPLHFTKFTSVPTSIGFTVPILLFMHFFYLPLYNAFQRLNKKLLYTLAVIFMVLLCSDFIFCAVRMYQTHDFLILWRVEL